MAAKFRSLSYFAIIVGFLWTHNYAMSKSILSSEVSTKLNADQQSAASDYKEKHNENGDDNYIPFQWKVEIIKREYDDYVLPDGTVYRVPHGAVPPHRHKGGPYNVPYYTFKEKGHSDKIYDKPKLVETYDTQTLELLQQRWYAEEEWKRTGYRKDPRYSQGDNYEASAPTNKHENKYDEIPQTTSQKQFEEKAQPLTFQFQDAPQRYYMRNYNGSQRWSNLNQVPGKTVTFRQISTNGPLGDSSRKRDQSDISDGTYFIGFYPDGNYDNDNNHKHADSNTS